ncbi:MAG TPA: hypothetical protein VD860_02910, partial [Azospirillum sp.]|nr:hypothetical protein [Azospirillum sp.]
MNAITRIHTRAAQDSHGNAPTDPQGPGIHPWRGFAPGVWQSDVNVRDFIVRNVTPYAGDRAFLAGATGTTKALWDKVTALLKDERAAKGGVLDADTEVFSSIV